MWTVVTSVLETLGSVGKRVQLINTSSYGEFLESTFENLLRSVLVFLCQQEEQQVCFTVRRW